MTQVLVTIKKTENYRGFKRTTEIQKIVPLEEMFVHANGKVSLFGLVVDGVFQGGTEMLEPDSIEMRIL